MSGSIAIGLPGSPVEVRTGLVPGIISRADERTLRRFLEFFAAHIRNVNTRAAYATAVSKFFAWCEEHGIRDLDRITRLHVSAYIEELTHKQSAPTVKQNLAAVRMLFDFLRVPLDNPAQGVRGPKHVVRKGRTPVLIAEQARQLLDSIDTTTIAGLRDRALIGLMLYTFGRVSAVVGMEIEDYFFQGTRRYGRLHEKGGKEHALPVHHRAEDYLDAYIAAAGLSGQKGPLFRTQDRHASLTGSAMSRHTAWEMVKRRALAAGLQVKVTNHSFRATGITVYLENGGRLETARDMANHADIKTTEIYDRRGDLITLDEINRIHL
jgi:site-specific recombinase XerD